MQLTREMLLEKVEESPMIPVFNHSDKDVALEIVRACYQGGARLFEFTNRSKEAMRVFKYLLSNQNEYPDMIIGIGSILNRSQCKDYFEAGAAFIVSPIVDIETAKFCKKHNVAWVPGCGTLTELITAERYGAGLLKVFPADVLGPKFIKGVLGPCGHLKLMPTGGVTPEKENLKSWFDAGVICVGMGSQLVSKEVIEKSDYEGLAQRVKHTFNLIKELKL